jgi:pimeloyl-ACP methyl ester carboxylesterase
MIVVDKPAADPRPAAVMQLRKSFLFCYRWTLRIVVGSLVFLIALALSGTAYQYFATRADFERLHPPGRIVTIEGHQFHIDCTGDGPLTVILESGAGATTLAWAWIQPEIAKSSSVCSYDRAGYGWSSPTDLPMDAINTSQQLHNLLRAANIPGPYILVGHSIGGAYVRMFAANYPLDVAGLVLLDATNPSVLETYAEVDLPKVEDWTPPLLRILPYLASAGAMRVAVGLGFFNLATGLPPDAEATAKAFLSQPNHIKTTVSEYAFLSETLKQIRSLKPQTDIPVAVIVADRFVGMDETTASKLIRWHQSQQRNWLTMSDRSSFKIVEGADHVSLVTNKLHAHEVATIILEMFATVRNQ